MGLWQNALTPCWLQRIVVGSGAVQGITGLRGVRSSVSKHKGVDLFMGVIESIFQGELR